MIDTFGHLKLTDFGLALKEESGGLKPYEDMKSPVHSHSMTFDEIEDPDARVSSKVIVYLIYILI
jgi:hypothetical protein